MFFNLEAKNQSTLSQNICENNLSVITQKSLSSQPVTFNTETSTKQLFSIIADQPWAIWLDSCESEHVDSRYDILVWQPSITITTTGNISQVINQNNDSCYNSTLDPLLLVKNEQLALFKSSQLAPSTLPFNGGALGYFSYDLGKRFEKIIENTIKDIAIPEMSVGIYQQAIIFDKLKNTYWLFCQDNKRDEITAFFKEALNNNSTKKGEHFSLASSWRSNMTKEQYQAKFEQVKSYLLSGDCYQINLAQRFTAQYQGDEFNAYLALRAENKAPFSAFMRFEDSAILSVSPERFLKLNHDHVQSKPIKGTRPRNLNANIDKANANELLQATKDRAENLMIVDLLRNDISRVCQPGTVKVPSLFAIESFPAVHHLVSTVEGKIQEHADGSDLLRAAFPGGSITGAPKIRAMDIIEELEPHQRSVYCGSIGYISTCGNMDTSITIRTLVCHNQQIHCWAGGGLVADSQVDSEYQETYDKVNKILPALAKLGQSTR